MIVAQLRYTDVAIKMQVWGGMGRGNKQPLFGNQTLTQAAANREPTGAMTPTRGTHTRREDRSPTAAQFQHYIAIMGDSWTVE